MRLTFEKRVLLIIAACIAISLAIVLLIILPFVRRIQDLNQQTYDLRVYLEKKHKRAVDYNIAVKTLEKISPQVSGFDQHVYYSADALKLITLLENIATKNSVEQKINSSNLDAGAAIVQLSVQITGNYPQVLGYIHDIETSNYFINIRNIQMNGSINPVDKTENVSATLGLSLYAN